MGASARPETDFAKLKKIADDLTARGVPDAEIERVLQRQVASQTGQLGAIVRATNRADMGEAEVADAEENVRRQSVGAGDIQNMGDAASLGLRQPITSALKALVGPGSFGEDWNKANAQEGEVRRAYDENTGALRRLAVATAPGLMSGKSEYQLLKAGLKRVAPRAAARVGESWLGRAAASKLGGFAMAGGTGAGTTAALTTDTSQDEGALAGLRHRATNAAKAVPVGMAAGVALGGGASVVARRLAPALDRVLPKRAGAPETSLRGDIAKVAARKASDLSENEIDTLNRWVGQNGGLDTIMARLPEWEAAGRGDVVRLVDLINDPRVLRELRGAAIGSKDAGAVLQGASDLPASAGRLNNDLEVVSGRSRADVTEGGEAFKARREREAKPSYDAGEAEAMAKDRAWSAAVPPEPVPSKIQTGARTPAGTLKPTLEKVADDDLMAEYAHLVERQGETNTNQQGAYRYFETDYGDTGVASNDRVMRAGGEMAARQKGIDRIEAELARRGISPDDAVWKGGDVLDNIRAKADAARGKSSKSESAEFEAFLKGEAPSPATAEGAAWRKQYVETVKAPNIRRAIKEAMGASELHKLPPTDHRVLAYAYQLMKTGENAGYYSASDRQVMADLVGKRAPSWLKGNADFADASVGRDLYEQGQRFLSGKEAAFSDAGSFAGQRGGDLTRFRDGVIADFFDKMARGAPSDPAIAGGASRDLVKRVFGTEDVMRKMRLALGDEAYGKMVERLRKEALLALRDRGVFSGSNTADKVADLMDDTNPEKALEAAWQLIQGNPVAAGVAGLRAKGTDIKQFVNRATGRAGTLAERARVATTQGAGALKTLADQLRAAQVRP